MITEQQLMLSMIWMAAVYHTILRDLLLSQRFHEARGDQGDNIEVAHQSEGTCLTEKTFATTVIGGVTGQPTAVKSSLVAGKMLLSNAASSVDRKVTKSLNAVRSADVDLPLLALIHRPDQSNSAVTDSAEAAPHKVNDATEVVVNQWSPKIQKF